MSSEYKTQMLKALVKICNEIGLKPEAEELQIAYEFILRNFRACTPKNVYKAFDLNSSGKYWNPVSHFGSMDTIFIGKVLRNYVNARRSYMVKTRKMIIKTAESQASPATEKEATEWMEKIRREINSNKMEKTPYQIKRDLKRQIARRQIDLDVVREAIDFLSNNDLESLRKQIFELFLKSGEDENARSLYNEIGKKIKSKK